MRASIALAATMAAGYSRSSSAFELRQGSIISSANRKISYVETTGESSDGPTTLFIHGLDSSSHTWRGVQQSLATPSVAIDNRGCGRSDLGDPEKFSPEALVEDVKSLVKSHHLLRDRRFVLVGHSMGGRIAMNYIAKHPNDVSAVVIEDMDIKRRSVASNFIPKFDYERAIAFERSHESMGSLKKELDLIGYPADMYSKWIDEGRIYPENGNGSDNKIWSEVNPAFRALCYQTVFDSDSGAESWSAITKNCRDIEGDTGSSIHLMVAGIGTVCDEESLQEMCRSIPSVLRKTYVQGTHSIHNSARNEFMADLQDIIKNAS